MRLADEETRKIEKRVAREAAQKKLEDALTNGMRICVDCNWTEVKILLGKMVTT